MTSPTSGQYESMNALVGAGKRVTKRDSESIRRLAQPWQKRSLSYYDSLGPIKYAAQFYARALANLRLFVAERDEAGELVETTNQIAIDEFARIQDPGGGRSTLLSSYGRLMFLTGEALLLCSYDQDTGQEKWEVLSTDELNINGSTYLRYRAPSLSAEELQEPNDDDWRPITDQGGKHKAVAYRLWRKHPRFSDLADCTMMGVLDDCEELLLLTQAVRSRIRSRLAGSGILFIDERISPIPPSTGPDDDPDTDVFMAALVEAMTASIVDEGAASAVVPLVVRVPVVDGLTVKEMVAHVQILDPAQLYPESGMRRECIERIAQSLDMPPEILLGLSGANHWSSWMVDEQTWRDHLQPIAQQMVDDLTSAFLRPSLSAAGVSDWGNYQIAYDAAAVINHPDKSKNAKDLYDRRAIGKKALREADGFTDDDAATQEETNEQLGVQIRDSSLAVYGIPAMRSTGGIETAPGVIEVPGSQPTPAAPGAPTTGGEVTPSAPTPPAEQASAAQLHRILGAADLALLRTREAAGNRIRSLAKRNADVTERLNGTPPRQVAAVLGPEIVRGFGVGERELVSTARPLIIDALRMFGVADDVAEIIANAVEVHAARTLYEDRPVPMPDSFAGYLHGELTRV